MKLSHQSALNILNYIWQTTCNDLDYEKLGSRDFKYESLKLPTKEELKIQSSVWTLQCK